MAGIYIHVPFCKTRCTYCDFFTRTDMKQKNPYVEALCKELRLRNSYLERESISSIYFGGGTPSQLNISDLSKILNTIDQNYEIEDDVEVTLEANPDDLDTSYINNLLNLGFNRLSIGVQSFNDTHLQFLNRRHSAQRAEEVVRISQEIGFKNISIDLMYGLPDQTMEDWERTLSIAIGLGVEHISSYHLIYEQGTKLYRLLQIGEVKSVNEDLSLQMFTRMIERLGAANFIHYEISNFGKFGYFSRHNTSYWLDTKYLGVGPAAHSYNQINRSWNIASIPKYIEAIKSGIPSVEEENRMPNEVYNDFILTGMRTMWGVSFDKLTQLFGEKYGNYFRKNINKHLRLGVVEQDGTLFRLTKKGIFISDSVMSDLMYID